MKSGGEHLVALGQDLFPGIVDQALKIVEIARVVDDDPRSGPTLLAGRLSGDPGPGIGLGKRPVRHQPLHRQLGVEIDDDRAHHALPAGFGE